MGKDLNEYNEEYNVFIGSCSLYTVYNKQILINMVTNISKLGWQNSQAK